MLDKYCVLNITRKRVERQLYTGQRIRTRQSKGHMDTVCVDRQTRGHNALIITHYSQQLNGQETAMTETGLWRRRAAVNLAADARRRAPILDPEAGPTDISR